MSGSDEQNVTAAPMVSPGRLHHLAVVIIIDNLISIFKRVSSMSEVTRLTASHLLVSLDPADLSEEQIEALKEVVDNTIDAHLERLRDCIKAIYPTLWVSITRPDV